MERVLDLHEGEEWSPDFQEINRLLIEEKAARHENDHNALAEICSKIIQICYDNGKHARMNEFLIMLCKRRGQPKKPIVEMISLTMKLVDTMPKDLKMKGLETLRQVTEGKLFLEVEYARTTKSYCKMQIEEGDLEKASETIQEVQVETYGSMEKYEKVEYVLYQIELMLEKKDYIRTYILSKKLDAKHLNEKGFEPLKIKYYQQMIEYYINEKLFFQTAESYQKILDTLLKNLELNPPLATRCFQNMLIFLFISPYSPERTSLLKLIQHTYLVQLDSDPILDQYLSNFLATEISPLNIDFTREQVANYQPFTPVVQNYELHFEHLIKLITHHNLKLVERYYSRITLSRLANLLNVDKGIVEQEIAFMVQESILKCKIDRMNGLVNFMINKHQTEIVNNWGSDINTLLTKIHDTCHFINREHVLYQKK